MTVTTTVETGYVVVVTDPILAGQSVTSGAQLVMVAKVVAYTVTVL